MTQTNLERTLLKEIHVKRVEWFSTERMPEIDINLWNKESRGEAAGAIDTLKEYISSPIVYDDFEENHSARRRWREDFRNAHPKLFYRDPLRANSLVSVYIAGISLRGGYIGQAYEQLEQSLDSFLEGIPDGNRYQALRTEAKVGLVREIKRKAYDILSFLAEQKMEEQTE